MQDGTDSMKNTKPSPKISKITIESHNLIYAHIFLGIQSRMSDIFAHPCSLQHYSQQARGESNPNVHLQMNE